MEVGQPLFRFLGSLFVAQLRRARPGVFRDLTPAARGTPFSFRAFPPLLENCIASTSILFSKLQEPTVDALAPEADEGRG